MYTILGIYFDYKLLHFSGLHSRMTYNNITVKTEHPFWLHSQKYSIETILYTINQVKQIYFISMGTCKMIFISLTSSIHEYACLISLQ